MKLRTFSRMLTLGLVSSSLTMLAACNSQDSSSSNGSDTASQAPNVTKTLDLKLVQNGEQITRENSNHLSLMGANGITVQYNFNSGNFSSIKVLRLTQSTDGSAACAVSADQITLINPAGGALDIRQNIGNEFEGTLGIEKNTDYTLQIQKSSDCHMSDFKLDVVVAGSLNEASSGLDPNGEMWIARRCTVDGKDPAYFLPINSVTTVTNQDLVPGETGVFGGNHPTQICGTPVTYSSSEMEAPLIQGSSRIPVSSSVYSDDLQTSYHLEFEAKNQFLTGTLTCRQANQVTQTKNLSDCSDMIINYTLTF